MAGLVPAIHVFLPNDHGEGDAVRKGWTIQQLASVANISNGGTPDTKMPAYWDGGIAWLTPKDMGKAADVYVSRTTRTISAAGLQNSSARIVPPASVILSTRAPIGHLAINRVEMAFNQGCRGLIPKAGLSAKYLFYFLLANVELLNDLGSGTTFKELSAGTLSSVQMPVPPLPEQRRIVAILDEAFASIDAATANTEKNLANSHELLRVKRDSILFEGHNDWQRIRLGHLISIKHGYAFKSEFFRDQGDYVLLTPGNFYESGGFRERGTKQKMYSGPVPEGFILEPGSLLVAMTEQAEGLLGSPIIVPNGGPYLHNQRLGLIRAQHGVIVHIPFLVHVFNSTPARRWLHESGTGTKVRHTSPEKIGLFEANIPPATADQVRIATELDEIAADVARLADAYTRKLALLAELRQSLLARAFAGELTASTSLAA